MNKISYSGYRFPPEIIQQAIWLYLRFTLSLRDVEELLAERGVAVSYETVRRWVNHFGPMIAAHLRKRRLKPHTTWHLDEVYLKIDGRMVYLWRAVDADVRSPSTVLSNRTTLPGSILRSCASARIARLIASHVPAWIALIVLCNTDFFGVHETGRRAKARNEEEIFQMKSQLLIAQLTMLLEQPAAQRRFRR